MLQVDVSDTAATSQDDSTLEFVPAIPGRLSYIQDASGRGLCDWFLPYMRQREFIG